MKNVRIYNSVAFVGIISMYLTVVSADVVGFYLLVLFCFGFCTVPDTDATQW